MGALNLQSSQIGCKHKTRNVLIGQPSEQMGNFKIAVCVKLDVCLCVLLARLVVSALRKVAGAKWQKEWPSTRRTHS